MSKNLKIDPYGFREYDARWLYEKDINSDGITNLGKGLGTQIKIHTQKNNPRVIVGHDYRSYSEEIKSALKKGLISTGCHIEDVGLSLSPMVYFAQFNLNADAVAMVTASHNENGWTGVKMGIKKGLTHAPEEMKELKDITLNEKFSNGEGTEKQIENYLNSHLTKVFSASVADKFGDNGLTAIVIVALESGTANIDTFIMSCRIMGRTIEYAIMNYIVNYFCEAGIHFIEAEYRETAKNKPVSEFYEHCGFKIIESKQNKKKYRLEVNNFKQHEVGYISYENN